MLSYMLDEDEFLSPYGIRSVSRYHEKHPYELNLDGTTYKVDYVPGESNTHMFGGNSNWRGPIWHCSKYWELCFGFLCFVSSQGTQADNSQLCREIYRNFNYFSERGFPEVQLTWVVVKRLKAYSQSLEICIRKKLNLFFCLFSVNYLIVEALKRHDYFYGNSFKVECPTGSGNLMRLRDVSMELSRRLVSVFLPDKLGYRPCHGNEDRYATDEDWNRLVLFYEYFDPESGRGCGARWENKTGTIVSSMYHLIIYVANLYNEKLLSKWSLARSIKSPW